MLKTSLINTIRDMEEVAKLFQIEPFEIYFLGGAACVLGNYSDRATKDFDFIDQLYEARLGKVFVMMRDFDMLDYETTILSPGYKARAKRLSDFEYLKVYILSMEDIIVSKIIRLEEKDIEDIDILIQKADKVLLNTIINEVLAREDLVASKKQSFIAKLPDFRRKYHV